MKDWVNRCHFGDVREVLRRMIAAGVKVNSIVTSPPYWGLRSYLPDDHALKPLELGHEPTLHEFLLNQVEVFSLARELLTEDGTAWVNMGDCYITSGGMLNTPAGADDKTGQTAPGIAQANRRPQQGLKPKDMAAQHWRLALALQDGTMRCTGCGAINLAGHWPVHQGRRVCVACVCSFNLNYQVVPHAPGWWLRSDIIWNKPNPMPESIRDRPTKAHEYLFLLAKSEEYYFNFEAWKEPVTGGARPRRAGNGVGFGHGYDANPKERVVPTGWDTGAGRAHTQKQGRYAQKTEQATPGVKNNTSMDAALASMPENRNRRTVWTITTEGYKGAHFATYPQKLVEPCLLAAMPPRGTVLDIYFGSGTTGQVAQRMGFNWIGIDLDARNDELQRNRIGSQPGLSLHVS